MAGGCEKLGVGAVTDTSGEGDGAGELNWSEDGVSGVGLLASVSLDSIGTAFEDELTE